MGAAARLPDETRMGPVELTVSDLERSVRFYERTIGLRAQRREQGRAVLGGGGEDVLVLVEEPRARPAGNDAGLYHVALLYPSRLELARVARRIAADGVRIQGASDHGTHEAIYLPDPDGIGLELAADRPRSQWPDMSDPQALFAGGPAPLDLRGLLALAPDQVAAGKGAEGTRVGHVHLHVGEAGEALGFYRDLIGLELMLDLTPSAAFLAAGGYHHHVAINTWRGRGSAPEPGEAVGLRHFTIVVPSPAEVAKVRARAEAAGATGEEASGGLLLRDPSGNVVLVAAEG